MRSTQDLTLDLLNSCQMCWVNVHQRSSLRIELRMPMGKYHLSSAPCQSSSGSVGKSIWLEFRRPRFESWLCVMSVITVKLMVDEHLDTTPPFWEARKSIFNGVQVQQDSLRASFAQMQEPIDTFWPRIHKVSTGPTAHWNKSAYLWATLTI